MKTYGASERRCNGGMTLPRALYLYLYIPGYTRCSDQENRDAAYLSGSSISCPSQPHPKPSLADPRLVELCLVAWSSVDGKN